MRYRKKPVVIDAFQLDPYPHSAVPDWMAEALLNGTAWYQGGDEPYVTIRTLEGDHRANVGDWIIRGVKGEIYPCKPDIFAITYEEAADDGP